MAVAEEDDMSSNLIWDPLLPVPAIAVIGTILVAWTWWSYGRGSAPMALWRTGILAAFRTAGLVLVVLLLLQPSRQESLPPPTKDRVTLIATDTSASMNQRDVASASRLDAAKNLLLETEAVTQDGSAATPWLRLFQFDVEAQPISGSLLDVAARGTSTRLHSCILSMLEKLRATEAANALILLSDGHDFELVNPAKTGAAARARRVPIYAVALGEHGKARDVSARIANFQPYTYVKQKARVSGALRVVGCEFEDLTVQLLRQGQVVESQRVNAGEQQELSVEFQVAEPEVGQYEYEIRVAPMPKEADTANNSAITYLNVIDQQIRVLLLEGDPYWDMTFLQRSLLRNDKFDVDALVHFGDGKTRAIRKSRPEAELRAPDALGAWAEYDLVILGKAVDRLLKPASIAWLNDFVKDRGGAVVFARGRAFGDEAADLGLEPVLWGASKHDQVKLDATAEGRSLSAMRALGDAQNSMDGLPALLKGREATQIKPLASTLAVGADAQGDDAIPAVVHRRYGLGQVMSVGVEGLWRWGLNAGVEGANSPFDRFWDQMILWMLAGRDFIPTRQFSFRPQAANVLLGEKAYFRVSMRQPDSSVRSIPLTLFLGDTEVSRTELARAAADSERLVAEFLPERTGRYRAVAAFPDGTSQETRFIVFTDNLEETEVATDLVGLRRLCESSGGRLIVPEDLGRLLSELSRERVDLTPKTRLRPVWNQAWVFYVIGVLFGVDWMLRRRWGLC